MWLGGVVLCYNDDEEARGPDIQMEGVCCRVAVSMWSDQASIQVVLAGHILGLCVIGG